MSTASRESKAFMVSSFALAFFGVPAVAWDTRPENLVMITAGCLGLMTAAMICLICGISGLLKEGVISFPHKPLIPLPGVILCAMVGVAASLYVIEYAGLLSNMGLTLWVLPYGST